MPTSATTVFLSSRVARLAACALAAAAFASGAAAQTSGGGSQFNGGYGSTSAGSYSTPINVSRAYDSSGNHVVIDGVTQTGTDGSVFYQQKTGGAADTYAGAGAVGYGTAIGNNLVVSVAGNNNTVVVNSTQTNTGAVTAKTVLNGKVNLDGTDGGA